MQDGQIIPQIDSGIHGGFGYAINLFYPPLSAYLAVLANLVSPNWNIAINLSLVFTQLLAGVAMYFLVRGITGRGSAGVISAIAYMSYPYLITNFTIRFAVGEQLAMAIAPFVLLGIWKIIHGERGWLLLGLSTGALLLSHNLSTFIFALVSLLFLATYWRRVLTRPAIYQLLMALAVALGVAAFFIFPLLEARVAAEYNAFVPGFMSDLPLVIRDTMWWFGPALIPSANIPFAWLGIPGLITLAFIPLGYQRATNHLRKFIIMSLVLSAGAFFASTWLFPWDLLPESLLFIQFPWRLNMVIALLLSALAGVVYSAVWDNPHRAFAIPIAGVAALITAGLVMAPIPLQGRLNVYDHANHWMDTMLVQVADYFPTRVINYVGDGSESWSPSVLGAPQFLTRPSGPLALSGIMEFFDFTQYGRRLQMEISVQQGGIVELPVFFYPGYQAFIDGVRAPIFESENGFVAFLLPTPGTHQVEAYFGMSPATIAGATVTGVTLLGLSIYAVVHSGKRTTVAACALR